MYRAKVLRQHPTNTSVNKKTLYRLGWTNPEGHECQSLAYTASTLRSFTPGSDITAFKGIKRDWWEGDVGPRHPEP